MYIKPDTHITFDSNTDDQSAWVDGRMNDHVGYSFSARVSETPAKDLTIPKELQEQFHLPPTLASIGIDGGRIQKLSVYFNGHEVISFNRGWQRRASGHEQSLVLQEIISAFPPTPEV